MKKFVSVLLLSLLLPKIAFAHVSYVLGDQDLTSYIGNDFPYFFSALFDTFNLILILTAIAILIALYWVAHHNHAIDAYFAKVRIKLEKYSPFIPWILRLSLGIALIGASTKEVLISPLLPSYQAFAFLQLLCGFMLLAGFLYRPIVVLSGVLFFFAYLQNSFLLGNLEFLAGIAALYILSNPKPGVDDIFFKKLKPLKDWVPFVPFIIRLGLGLALIFSALYEKILNPHLSRLVVEKFNLTGIIGVSPEMWIFSAGIIELIIGAFLLIGWHTRLTSAVAFAVITMTFFFFKEDVYSHITLFGLLSILFITGGGDWGIDTVQKKSPLKSVSKKSAK